MTDTDTLANYSDAIEARVRHGARRVAALCRSGKPVLSAVLWRPATLVTSEQSLPDTETLIAVLCDGASVPARVIGRDPATNVAVLRLEPSGSQSAPRSLPSAGAAPEDRPVWVNDPDDHAHPASSGPGALMLALGGDGSGGATVAVGHLEQCGPAWDSRAGGRIDQLLRVGVTLPLTAEGGPVLDARGALLGMSTFGPRRTVLVIPTATIERVAATLIEHGRVPRGWLGVGLHRVTLSREADTGADTGLMVVSLADGSPAADALIAGDVLLAIDGRRLTSTRDAAAAFGALAVGSRVALDILRGGARTTAAITIGAKP